jgi:hypothetical protein
METIYDSMMQNVISLLLFSMRALAESFTTAPNVLTEAPSTIPTEAPTEAPTEVATEAPTQDPTEAPPGGALPAPGGTPPAPGGGTTSTRGRGTTTPCWRWANKKKYVATQAKLRSQFMMVMLRCK